MHNALYGLQVRYKENEVNNVFCMYKSLTLLHCLKCWQQHIGTLMELSLLYWQDPCFNLNPSHVLRSWLSNSLCLFDRSVSLVQSIRSDILLRMWWHDLRLAYDNSSELTLAGDVSDIIWIPDVYVFNAIETERHKAFKSNIRTIIGPNGNIYTSLRYVVFASLFLALVNMHSLKP